MENLPMDSDKITAASEFDLEQRDARQIDHTIVDQCDTILTVLSQQIIMAHNTSASLSALDRLDVAQLILRLSENYINLLSL